MRVWSSLEMRSSCRSFVASSSRSCASESEVRETRAYARRSAFETPLSRAQTRKGLSRVRADDRRFEIRGKWRARSRSRVPRVRKGDAATRTHPRHARDGRDLHERLVGVQFDLPDLFPDSHAHDSSRARSFDRNPIAGRSTRGGEATAEGTSRVPCERVDARGLESRGVFASAPPRLARATREPEDKCDGTRKSHDAKAKKRGVFANRMKFSHRREMQVLGISRAGVGFCSCFFPPSASLLTGVRERNSPSFRRAVPRDRVYTPPLGGQDGTCRVPGHPRSRRRDARSPPASRPAFRRAIGISLTPSLSPPPR